LAGFAENAPATPAFYERAALLDAKEGHKEEREVMIYSLQAGLVESAGRTHASLAFELHGLRLNSCDEKKHVYKHPAKKIRIQKPPRQVKTFVSATVPLPP
jgi:hypothetical protein